MPRLSVSGPTSRPSSLARASGPDPSASEPVNARQTEGSRRESPLVLQPRRRLATKVHRSRCRAYSRVDRPGVVRDSVAVREVVDEQLEAPGAEAHARAHGHEIRRAELIVHDVVLLRVRVLLR